MEKLNEKNNCSRRGFLKTTVSVGAALTFLPALGNMRAATRIAGGEKVVIDNDKAAAITSRRTLGTGKAAFEVSALGFGVMGMTYHRSQHPDKKRCIRLLHEAVDRGVTLFDTAIIYGPLNNEELAGEALGELRGKVSITTKFGLEVVDGNLPVEQTVVLRLFDVIVKNH